MKPADIRIKAFSIIIVFWGLTYSGWASLQPREPTGATIASILSGAQGTADHGSTVPAIMRALVGRMVGESIASSMDDVDQRMVLLALENDHDGVPSQWRNPESRNMYTVTLLRAYDMAQGPCLEYTVEAVIGGKGNKVHNTACRLADGSWDVANDR